LGTPGKFWSVAGKLEARAPAMSVHGTKLRYGAGLSAIE
jgi:hypothetical protein